VSRPSTFCPPRASVHILTFAGLPGQSPEALSRRRLPDRLQSVGCFCRYLNRLAGLIGHIVYPPVEALNRSLRKIIKTRGSFPNDDDALELLYLALRNARLKWRRGIKRRTIASANYN
jgi:transposase-like protein